MDQRIIVIGAGVGGLATAMRLLHRGYKVTILEKNARVGGKVGTMTCEGFRFDTGATLVTAAEDYTAVFAEVGLEAAAYLRMARLDVHYRVFDRQGHRSTYSGELDQMLAELAQRSPQLARDYLDYLSDTYGKYLFRERYWAQAASQGEADWPQSRQKWDMDSAGAFVRHYFRDADFLQFLYFQMMYWGRSPEEGDSTLALVPAVVQLTGLWAITGGLGAYAQALAQAVRDLGGEILTETPATEIIVAGQAVVGVKTEHTVLLADGVVCDADYDYVLAHLLAKERQSPRELETEEVAYSCGTLIFHLALDRTYPELAMHNLLLSSAGSKNWQAPFRGDLPRQPLLYVYCPCRVDATAAPAGGEAMTVIWRVPNTQLMPGVWSEKLKQKLLRKTLARLTEQAGLADLSAHLLFACCTTPDDLGARFNCSGGASFGREPSGAKRCPIRAELVRGLYFVGDSTGAGAGVSRVLQGTKLVAATIAQEIATDRPNGAGAPAGQWTAAVDADQD